ncbi:MAG: UbiH/UbiF/VisC/COQ6 family ubiquinone biosynthesis hydroxylase [Rhodospirillales bacterium]|nr:UbiH/UbiF/VisC/COQ6 family ubiquinone biosynthesis hydroxylase [Rhodospirillales bacterium]
MAAAEAGERVEVDVVIAGGGLVGLTLGVALAGAGIETAVVDGTPREAMKHAAFDGRVSSIALGSRRVLDGIGIWPALADDVQPILEIRVSDGDVPLFLHYDHKTVGSDPLGYIVENRSIRAALLERAAALAALHHMAPASVEALEPGGGGIDARLADGRCVRARLAVAADGANSGLRAAAGIDAVRWSYEQTGIVCTVLHERPHRGIAHERFLPAGPFAILPMTVDRSSLVWTERATLAPSLMEASSEVFARELGARFGDFLGALEPTGPRWSYPLRLTHATRYVAPRLALAGDAAHAIHPLAGQGFNLGIRDAAVLAELVVDRARLGLDIGGGDVLTHYQRRRRFDSVVLIGVTDGLNRLFSNDNQGLRLVRDVGLAAVNQMPPVKRFFMRHAMGLAGDLPRLARGEPL